MAKKSKAKSKNTNSKAVKALAAKTAAIETLDSSVTFKVLSSDNVVFEVPMYFAQQAKALGALLDNIEDGSGMAPIPLQDVTAETFRFIFEWTEQHKGEEEYVSPSGQRKGKYRLRLPEWDYKWLKNLNNGQLFSLICATNYLDIIQLMDYACKTVANMARGKSVEEMRILFGIKADEDNEEALHEPGPSNARRF